MSYYDDKDDNDITRDGFVYSRGKFYAQLGRVERVEGSSLRGMFIPRITPEGRRLLDGSLSGFFVRGQLKHYGVQFANIEISGSGIHLLRKVLQAGKCDKVPDNITELREQMHAEWLNKLPPEQLDDP
jgi:hypothetical protein